MKEKDKIIIQELRKNARVPLNQIASKAGMPLSSTHNRLKKIEEIFVKKYASLIDFKMMGYSTWTKLVLKVSKPQREELKQYLLEHKNVNSLFEINSGNDFLAEVLHRDNNQLKFFIEELKEKFEIENIYIIDVINDLQRERFLIK